MKKMTRCSRRDLGKAGGGCETSAEVRRHEGSNEKEDRAKPNEVGGELGQQF